MTASTLSSWLRLDESLVGPALVHLVVSFSTDVHCQSQSQNLFKVGNHNRLNSVGHYDNIQ